jgi:hypothetical protein
MSSDRRNGQPRPATGLGEILLVALAENEHGQIDYQLDGIMRVQAW